MTQIKNIQAIKVGNIVNVSFNGILHKKNCGTSAEANELFKIVLKAKDNPTEENIKLIRSYLNERTRVAMLAGLENDPESGEVYLAGFNTSIPNALVEVIKEYHENGYPLEAIINFWKLLMINPDIRVRKSLFNFISAHDFVLTDKGYMIVYKAVDYKDDGNKSVFGEFISNQYLHVKKDWKCSPNKYTVYRDNETGNLAISKNETVNGWDLSSGELNIEVLGKLGELYDNFFNNGDADGDVPVYTDMRTHSMNIVLGQPVVMPRKECDSDPQIDCSYGLHVGATRYVENFAGSASAVLACFVSPANVVAVPDYDHSKMRVSEYFPFAIATYENDKIDVVEQAYFEDDYINFEISELEEQITKIREGEIPVETAINSEPEERPMSELLRIIESRIIDIE